MLHFYALIIFAIMLCLSSWGWAILPDKMERALKHEQGVTVPPDESQSYVE